MCRLENHVGEATTRTQKLEDSFATLCCLSSTPIGTQRSGSLHTHLKAARQLCLEGLSYVVSSF
jgi:hypothetical protein